jgi:hypothetical protein
VDSCFAEVARVGLGLPQEANDLFLGESALLHVRHSPGG